MDPFKAQQQVRQNATELSDYLSDLKMWTKEQNQTKNKSNDSPHNNDLPPIRNSAEAKAQTKQNEELASKFKTVGNDYFKAGKYKLAIQSYSKAIKATPNNAILYSNRAMAKLRTNDYSGAEADCDQCIDLDASQLKAWFRRGLARKSLKNYNKSLEDFQFVLKMDANNKAAKKEKIEIERKLQAMYEKLKQRKVGKKKNDKQGIKKKDTEKKESKMRRIVIEECSDSDSDSSSDEKDDIKRNKLQNGKPQKTVNGKTLENEVQAQIVEKVEKFEMNGAPTNFIEFEKMWSRAKIKENRALILLVLKDKRIDRIIKNMIDDALFCQMLRTVHYITMSMDVNDGLLLLKQLTKLDRFDMIVMFMEDEDQKLLQEMKQKCSDNGLDVAVFKKFQ